LIFVVVVSIYSAEGGELFDRVVEASKFSEDLSKFYFYQMMKAIKVSGAFSGGGSNLTVRLRLFCSISMTGTSRTGT